MPDDACVELFDLSLKEDLERIERIYNTKEVIESNLVMLPFREIIWKNKAPKPR